MDELTGRAAIGLDAQSEKAHLTTSLGANCELSGRLGSPCELSQNPLIKSPLAPDVRLLNEAGNTIRFLMEPKRIRFHSVSDLPRQC